MFKYKNLIISTAVTFIVVGLDLTIDIMTVAGMNKTIGLQNWKAGHLADPG